MGDDWDTEAAASGLAVASSAAVVAELPEVKLFGKWSTDDVQVNDISLNVRFSIIQIQMILNDS